MNHATPRPWKAVHCGGNKWEITAASPNVKGLSQTVGELNGPWKPENYRDNAKLIAAAPDLLAALIACEYTLDALKKTANAGCEFIAAVEANSVRAAIAKAGGGQCWSKGGAK